MIGGELHTAWANINEPGQSNRSHNHSGPFTRSGVYFVAGHSGALVFEPEGPVIEPDPGILILFPSSAIHRVEPGIEQRITVAFNFRD